MGGGPAERRPWLSPSEKDLVPAKQWCAEERGYAPHGGPARASAGRRTGETPDCAAWPIPGEAGRGRVQSPERLRRLAAGWLKPFASGIREADLMPRLGYNRSHCDRVSPSRICPLVIVRRGEIFVYIPVTSRLFPEVLPSCSHLGGNTPGGASMRRLLTVLRFLRSTLSSWSWWARRDFAVRVCVDEFCHGLFEDRPVPWLTMVSCAFTPSLPAVQWNTLKGRDPNLSEWESVLAQHAALADVANASWPCRIRRAVWRGSASEPYTTNMRWTGNRTLERIPISIGKWRAQGRLALMWQHCMNPELLDVHVRGLQGPNPGVGRNLRSDVRYTRCVAKLGIHKQKVLSLAEQARMYRYLVHVEGVGGWADRLKHLLLSHAALIKQDMGVTEWFEPLMKPFVHYVPVSSKLLNLSSAVRWLQNNDGRAQAIASAAFKLASETMTVGAMSTFMDALITGYARLYRDSAGVQALLARLPPDQLVKFDCGGQAAGGGSYDCSFVHRATGRPVESVLDAAKIDDTPAARLERPAGWC
mmetsp:Transcript_24596/g.79429  ORF Transcript_24596/g.79429 Transcript_24596/m.79429 type:complete len:531 (-) Transcript_24596:294-1886(-)